MALNLPDGWKAEPAAANFSLDIKGASQTIEFIVTPPKKQAVGNVTAVATVNGQTYDQQQVVIDYDHFPTQTLFPEATARVVRLQISKAGQRIGYVMGAGDQIPESLEQIGYSVELLEAANITADALAEFDAVILGVRAYNTVPELKYKQAELMAYVEQGGTMIAQYNTNRRLVVDQLGPYSLTLSRKRVTKEEAPVTILQPKHPVMSKPNQITAADFEGWVQERGLYFPDQWDEQYEAILASNDPGEDPLHGGLLVAKHGKGHYIYTGYSWFRELPAGVPGAYRIFANMISIGQSGGD